jgi:hypothetical protein
MAEQELNLRDIIGRLPPGADMTHLGADLWPRIAQAHQKRLLRRRTQRAAVIGTAAVMLVVAVTVPAWFARPAPAIDWQARAQALEIQLNALAGTVDADDVADAELARIDVALQAAYDRAAPANELVPLWKQRSDLLSALLVARQQQVTLTRI